MHKDLISQLRSINVNIVPKLDTSQRCALQTMHAHSHSNIIEVSQNRHIQLLYLNIVISFIKTHTSVIIMMSMIAFQLSAQPQRSIHNQRVNTSYAQKCLYANIPYWLKPYHKYNKYLCVQLDTWADVNLMPESIYKLVLNDLQTAKLAKNDIDLTVYTWHSVDLIGKCTFYILLMYIRGRNKR